MTQNNFIPVIAIDGPSASGKGTVASKVAKALGWHYLDSGALYRLTALAAQNAGVKWEDEASIAKIASSLSVEFSENSILMDGVEVSDGIRQESISVGASKVAVFPLVRTALLERQRAFRDSPGLVADGRDMASLVFPDAIIKVFLTASTDERAKRRHKQLIEKGVTVNISVLLKELQERDLRDQERSVAPLRQEKDAKLLDTTSLNVDEAVEKVLHWYRGVLK